MDEFAQFKITYFAECAELLQNLESGLSALNDGTADDECLHAIFRAVHSIKAGAGAFGFAELVAFSHKFEALLDQMRDGRVDTTSDGIAVLFKAGDILADLITAAESGSDLEPEFGADVADSLAAMLDGANDKAAVADASAKPEEPNSTEPLAASSEVIYRIVFRPKADLFQHANEPLLLVRELMTIGQVSIVADLSGLPELAALDPEAAYIGWTFEVKTDAGRETVEEVFEFVLDDCDLTIDVVEDEATAEAAPQDDSENSESRPQAPATGSTDQQTGGKTDEGAGGPAAAGGERRGGAVSSIRVELDRIDLLVNMVGELVITQSMLSQQTSDLPAERFPAMVRGLEELAMHTRELQESVMAIRMQPVKSVFARMPRLVRDLSSKLDKKVKLVSDGEDTEVDKTVIEEISDPITHMIRNSLDHGLEDTETRLAAGKSEEGTIRISAEHRGGRIVISIEDDGAGINREIVRAKAIERGLIEADANLSDQEIDNLIFAPGFSTASEVTNISGRGVGMDVVRRNIQGLGGRISIQSTPGLGTRFTMTLPLTLAVMDGMIVVVGGRKYIIPITNIMESIRPAPEDVHRLPTGGNVVAIRGEYAALVYLHEIFDLAGAEPDPSKGLVVLAETEGKEKVGIVVDELIGQQQVVIKSLESNFDPVPGIAAATILGNGMVAPILDIDGLRAMANSPTASPSGHPPGAVCAGSCETEAQTAPIQSLSQESMEQASWN